MLGLAIIAAAACFAVGAVRRLAWPLARIEQVALGVVFALTVTPWVLFVGAWSLGFAAGLPAGVAVLGATGLALARGRRAPVADGPGPSRLSWAVLAILFALLFHGHMLHDESGGLFTGGSTFGDLALHTTLAQRFAVDEVGFASPIVAGEPLTYPFLGDFLVACLVRGGWSMSSAFALTGWLSVMAGLALVDALARRIFARRAAGTIAVWLVVLSGALIGLWYAALDLAGKGLPSSPGEMPSYANQWDRGVTWSNIVCDFFLPQRAFLAAFPAVIAATLLLRAACDEARRASDERRLLGATAVLIGLLPMLHMHGFLIAAALLTWTAAARAIVTRRIPWSWLAAIVVALVVAAPQLYWQLGHSFHEDFGRWRMGWRAPRGEFWLYWLRNWGAPLVLAPAALVTAWRHRGGGCFPLVLASAAIVVFAAGNLYQFQPHDWDNMKFFVYGHVALAVVLGGMLAGWLAGGALRRGVAVLSLVAMTGTGALTLARELDRHDQIASTTDLAIARRLRVLLPPDARVLTSDQHNHAVPMLTGRGVVMGYRGWLWTHGLNYRPLERDVGRMFAGEVGTSRLLRRHGVTHVYIGPGEVRDWRANTAWYAARFPRVLAEHGVEVFDVRERLPHGDTRVIVAQEGTP